MPFDAHRSEDLAVNLPAGDGFMLGATLHQPLDQPVAAALIVPGGGIPATRYQRFARFLAAQGIATLTFDYRGIGRSRPGSLKGFEAVAEDWTEHDTGGAARWLAQRFPDLPRYGIGHSIGALMLLGAPEAERFAKLALLAPHTGYWGDYRMQYRLPMALLWHGVMPVLTHLCGYFPARRLHLGEDIPAGLALQWARRRGPTMRPVGPARQIERAHYLFRRCAKIVRPTLAVTFADDAFATAAGAKRLLALSPLIPITYWHASATDAGIARLDHFAFFSSRCHERLWPEFLRRLQALPG